MNETVKALQEERKSMYSAVYSNRIPKRVPVNISITNHMVASYGGISPIEAQFNYKLLGEPAMDICGKVKCDKAPVTPVGLNMSRPPLVYQILGAKSFVMGKTGQVQHPEVCGMEASDYDYLIEDPFACLLERVMPRQYSELNPEKPIDMLNAFLNGKAALAKNTSDSLTYYGKLVDAYGFYPGAPAGSSGFAEAPFDYIGDQLRGFSNVSMDIRREKKRLAEACEAVLPLMFYWGLNANPHPEGSTFTPLHMPTFMREKDFENLWLPTYVKLTQQWAACGVRTKAFCEDNWMRYLDHLMELPAGTELWFEYGDPKEIKEKLGKKFIITGLYPINLLKTGTKEDCIDKAKELLDIMMPGGNYIFGLDKNPLVLSDVNMENVYALTEFLSENAEYQNAGEAADGQLLNSEGFTFDETVIKPIESKYRFSWTDYKERNPLAPDSVEKVISGIDLETLKFYLNLLV